MGYNVSRLEVETNLEKYLVDNGIDQENDTELAKAYYKWAMIFSFYTNKIQESGMRTKAVPGFLKGKDFESPLSDSKALRAIGPENVAIFDFNGLLPKKWGSLSNVPKNKVVNSIVRKAFSIVGVRVYCFGVVTPDKTHYLMSHQSAKHSQVGKGIFLANGYYAEPMYLMGYKEHEWRGRKIKDWFKTKMNIWSGQLKYDDDCGLVGIKMENIRCINVEEFEYHISRIARFDSEGKKQNVGYGTEMSRPGDAIMLVIREVIETLFPGCLTHRVSQSRGRSMKKIVVDIPACAYFEKYGITHWKDADGKVHGTKVQDFIDEGIWALCTKDCLKTDVVSMSGSFEAFFLRDVDNPNVDTVLWQCAGKGDDVDETATSVTLSRQLVTAYGGLTMEEVRALADWSVREISEYKNDSINAMEHVITGFKKTKFARSIMQEEYENMLNKAMFSKIRTPGAFIFSCFEPLPLLMSCAIDPATGDLCNPADYMQLHGAECYCRRFEDKRFCCMQRYPSLKRAGTMMRIKKDVFSDDLCPNVIFLSWTCPFNMVQKGDCDGDTPIVTAPFDDEIEELSTYDFDELYIPDDDDDITWEEFKAIQAREHTVSHRRMLKLAALNGDTSFK